MTWSLIGHKSELAKPGDYLVLSSGAEQVLAYNDAGTVMIGTNRCLHRGSRIFSGTHGNAPLKCPYHGMTGAAIQKPMALTAWIGDFLFAGDGSTRIEDDLGDLRSEIEAISYGIARRHSFDMMPMSCDWKVAVENTLEDLHVPSVHPDTFGKLALKAHDTSRIGRNSACTYVVGDEHTVRGLKAMSKHFVDARPDSYRHILLWPSTAISSLGGFTYSVQQYLPAGGFTYLHTRLYAGKTKDTAPNLTYFFDEAAGFNRTVFVQDAAACANVAGEGTFLTENEQRVAWFREACK